MVNGDVLSIGFRCLQLSIKPEGYLLKYRRSIEQLFNSNENDFIIFLWILSFIILSLLAGLFYCYLYFKYKNEKRIEHLKGIIAGEERERERLARELHDGINSQLTAIQSFLIAESINGKFSDAKNLKIIENLVVDTAVGVRNIARNLAPETLIQKGLKKSIQEFCYHIFSPKGIVYEIAINGNFDHLPTRDSLNIYRILQEVTQNIVKHANAQNVHINLSYNNKEIVLYIRDDGKGIKDITSKLLDKKFLWSIRSRIASMQGILQIESSKLSGTQIKITITISQKHIDSNTCKEAIFYNLKLLV